MGYDTNFNGKFKLDRPLKKEHADYLSKFSETRRMMRDQNIANTLPDPLRISVGLPVGTDGEYFVGGCGFAGQGTDASIKNNNIPPATQPGLWCQWVPSINNDSIEWDGGEKFTKYIGWIKYLLDHFLKPWGYVLNGTVEWQGEDPSDTGVICIKNNEVEITTYAALYEQLDHDLKSKVEIIKQLEQKIADLETTNHRLQLEIDYRPDGKGALDAQKHFESMTNMQ